MSNKIELAPERMPALDPARMTEAQKKAAQELAAGRNGERRQRNAVAGIPALAPAAHRARFHVTSTGGGLRIVCITTQ